MNKWDTIINDAVTDILNSNRKIIKCKKADDEECIRTELLSIIGNDKLEGEPAAVTLYRNHSDKAYVLYRLYVYFCGTEVEKHQLDQSDKLMKILDECEQKQDINDYNKSLHDQFFAAFGEIQKEDDDIGICFYRDCLNIDKDAVVRYITHRDNPKYADASTMAKDKAEYDKNMAMYGKYKDFCGM